ncbi:chromosomal replication initiator protein DnaA [Candidatus Peregrinibacteria bacterium]|nr:chromosomal replication initiator protein DnaA [Candidatus Peregrinibacteria bacterium]
MAQRDTKQLWVDVIERIKPTIQKAHILTWFAGSAILEKKEDGTVIVGLATTFAETWIAGKYTVKILQALQEMDDSVISVQYQVCPRLAEKNNIEGVDVKSLFANEEKKVKKVRNLNEVNVSRGGEKISSKILNERYTLFNFISGRANLLPHAACTAVSSAPGGVYNPLYIYGSVGLGKTHLLQAVGNEVLKNFPDMVVKYITAERFVTEVVAAIGNRYMSSFKDQYRNVDVFLLDDVQFFARKDSSQQEFFHTFNELYDRNKQIILTSDRPPKEIDDLDERLKSRFGMGMVVELIPPDFETRVAILNQKCKEFQLILDPEVLQFIATNLTSNVRELEGVLRQAVAESELSNKVTTIRSVAEIIRKLNKAQEIIGYDIDARKNQAMVKTSCDVMNIVSDYYRLTMDDLIGQNRHKEFMIPRQVCMYIIKHELGESYERIGAEFGGRNHTTVMHACRQTEKILKKNVKIVRDINTIKKEMGL